MKGNCGKIKYIEVPNFGRWYKEYPAFFGLGVSNEYEKACKKVVYDSPSKSRAKVNFTKEQKEIIREKSNIYDTLDKYTI